MQSYKEHRFKNNPKEEEFYNKFLQMFSTNKSANVTLSAIIFGWENDQQNYPKEYLTEKGENICINLIQWLGSPVGEAFLNSCGFFLQDDNILMLQNQTKDNSQSQIDEMAGLDKERKEVMGKGDQLYLDGLFKKHKK